MSGTATAATLVDHYRCPDIFLKSHPDQTLFSASHDYYLRSDDHDYPQAIHTSRSNHVPSRIPGMSGHLQSAGAEPCLPFDADQAINDLRLERYARRCAWSELSLVVRFIRDLYYFSRPWLSLGFRKYLQRAYHYRWEKIAFPSWPVDTTVERISNHAMLNAIKATSVDRVPFVWFWPNGARSALVITHDIEAQAGYDFSSELIAIDKSFGIRASFQIVPEGTYKVSDAFLQNLRDQDFEINIQDLNHDGRLFSSLHEFRRRVSKINAYRRSYNANGFRAAVLYRNLDWYDALDFSYDMSVPNVAHLDPQRGGCCTVMPYFVHNILELPLTTTQDYMLFHLLGDYSLNLWKVQMDLILKNNGLISFLIHPDYVREEKALGVYCALLSFLRDLGSREQLWFALPGEVDQWWRDRSQMQVVNRGGHWQIEGPGAERAVLAFAKADGNHLQFEISPQTRQISHIDS